VNWGDGNVTSYRSAPNAIHEYASPGTYQISVEAIDNKGNVVTSAGRKSPSPSPPGPSPPMESSSPAGSA
jgi:hypothetical protein